MFSFLGVLFILLIDTAISEDAGNYLDLYGVNGIMLWTEPNCQGIPASTIFNDTTLGQNISNACISQSFKLLRPLHGEEQLDISIAPQLDLWTSIEGQSSANSLGCTSFIQSYFPMNESGGCHNTPPFTCHRLWINSGLSLSLRGPLASSTLSSSQVWPLIVPPSCDTSAGHADSSPSKTLSRSEMPFPRETTPRETTPPSKTPLSSHSASRVHTVQVNGSFSGLFEPRQLHNIPVGDIISFQSHGIFQLINTTLENMCEVVHRSPTGTRLEYRVTGTEPAWFFGCPPMGYNCLCNQDTHFALNPGSKSKLYKEKVTEAWVLTPRSTQPPPTTVQATGM
ncbi:uncharacterized protein BDV17DRAFT_265646 [Aspergillus undulatus]|uniref:uncharacterized protein n=1 Tax=Aspergillus undulatus TaxID=1810928 RepID=UPI003CCDC0DC